jgi:hypothetical protein
MPGGQKRGEVVRLFIEVEYVWPMLVQQSRELRKEEQVEISVHRQRTDDELVSRGVRTLEVLAESAIAPGRRHDRYQFQVGKPSQLLELSLIGAYYQRLGCE